MRDSKCLALAVRVYESDRHQVILDVDTPEVAQSERPIYSCMQYRTPKVDDLEAPAKEGRGFLWREMPMNTGNRRRRRLVHMNKGDWLALLWAII
jgi:hypothetical protein